KRIILHRKEVGLLPPPYCSTFSAYALVTNLYPHSERNSRRCGDHLASASDSRRASAEVNRRALYILADGSESPEKDRADRAGGNGSGRRPRGGIGGSAAAGSRTRTSEW